MRHRVTTVPTGFSSRRVVALVGAAVFLLGTLGAPMTGLSPAFAGKKKDKKNRKVREILLNSGAFLGVKMQELSDEVREGLDIDVKTGVLINEVIEDSPAEKAGIEDGDVIVKFGRKKATSPERLRELVQEADIGDKVKVELYRDNKSRTVEVTLGDWSDQPSLSFVAPDLDFDFGDRSFVSAFRPVRLGVRVSELNQDLASYFGVDEGEGVLVLDVHDESTAQEAGMKAGDVIVDIAGDEVHSVGDIHDAMDEMDAGDEFEMTVVRKKKRVKLEGEVTESSRAFFGDRTFSFGGRAPHIEIRDRDDMREQLKQLRKELDELKKELGKS